jgi:hypothetical protein
MSKEISRAGAWCFLETSPLKRTKELAELHGCDIAIPNHAGIGNILMYTRVVEDMARSLGRPLKVLTSGLRVRFGGLDAGEDPYSIWSNNPFVDEIIDADFIGPEIQAQINKEMDNFCQFSHMIENIEYQYGLRPRRLRPSLFLSKSEQQWAIGQLGTFARPIVCIHPHGKSSPKPGNPWHEENWRRLIARLDDHVTILEVFKIGWEKKHLPTKKFGTTLRQMMALVWASDVFVGFDSSVAHVATAFNIPSLVLWDPFRKLEIEERFQTGFAPAAMSRWSYPQNRNIVLLGDRDDQIVSIIAAWIHDYARHNYHSFTIPSNQSSQDVRREDFGKAER